jgi:RNA polymerase sigma-70 factor (ECF subfamily)
VDQETPEKIYERHWAMAVLERAQGRLRAECLAAGKAELYRELGETDGAAPRESYAEIGARLGMTENAVKLTAFRLRRRYQDLIREEIAETLARPEEIDEEIRYLLRVLAD